MNTPFSVEIAGESTILGKRQMILAIVNNKRQEICRIYQHAPARDVATEDGITAIAAIFAAAPDLLDALSSLLEVAWPNEQPDSRTNQAIAKAQAAIAKAKGKL